MVQLHKGERSALKDAVKSFTVIEDSIYANKNLGSSGQLEVMTCECDHHRPTHSKKHEKVKSRSRAKYNTEEDDGDEDESEQKSGEESSEEEEELCGPSSNCINRLTYMECYDEYCCDANCGNRRFQKHQHMKVDVFNAGKKGFGVRALENIPEGAFIYEYTGEVLDEQRFLKRQQKYDREGVKHFYFMMLQKDEFIDATEKGSIARFCNHSCNPNVQIEKWVVGPKLRMGLFAKRDIQDGEELCFDYKVDRYGSKAQPCYCGESNCSGFLGGRTQTGGTLLPPSVVEGLGLDSDTALSWPESALQKLQSYVNKLGLDLESVLLNESGNGTSLNVNASQFQNQSESQPQDPQSQQDAETPSQENPLKDEQDLSPDQSLNQSQHQSQHQSQDQNQDQNQDQSQSKNLGQNLDQSQSQNLNQNHNQDQSQSQSQSQSPEEQRREPSQDLDRDLGQDEAPSSKKKNRRRTKNKTADLIALLDAQPSSLKGFSRTAQQLLLDMFPSNALDYDQLPEFMRILMQSQDRAWFIALMLRRVLSAELPVQLSLLRMHGYEIMATVLNRWRDQPSVVAMGISVLQQWPKMTRNKISSSQIEAVVRQLRDDPSIEDKVKAQATSLLEEWNGLSMGYRIPRRKLQPEDTSQNDAKADDTINATANTSTPPPRSGVNGHEGKIAAKSDSRIPPAKRPKKMVLPDGWEARTSSGGETYYYHPKTNVTSWKLPKDSREVEHEAYLREKELRTEKARQAALQKEREQQANEIQRIIDEAEGQNTTGTTTPNTSQTSSVQVTPKHVLPDSVKSPSKMKKPSLESIFAAYIPKLVFKFEEQLGHDRCKRHARDVVHVLVKKEQIKGTDPAKLELTPERKNKIKGFVKDYMAKVVARHQTKSTSGQSSASGTPQKKAKREGR